MIPDSFPHTAQVEKAALDLTSMGFEYSTVPLFSDDTNTNTFRKRVECIPSGPNNVVAKLPPGMFSVEIRPGMFELLHEMPAYGLLKSFKTLSFEYDAAVNFIFRHGHDLTADEGEIYRGTLAKASFKKA